MNLRLPVVTEEKLCTNKDDHQPCFLRSCRYHLLNHRSQKEQEQPRVAQLEESCALRVAEDGEHTLEEIADLTGYTRERIRQLEHQALRNLKHKISVAAVHGKFELELGDTGTVVYVTGKRGGFF